MMHIGLIFPYSPMPFLPGGASGEAEELRKKTFSVLAGNASSGWALSLSGYGQLITRTETVSDKRGLFVRVIVLALSNCATVAAVPPPITHTSIAATAYTYLYHE